MLICRRRTTVPFDPCSVRVLLSVEGEGLDLKIPLVVQLVQRSLRGPTILVWVGVEGVGGGLENEEREQEGEQEGRGGEGEGM